MTSKFHSFVTQLPHPDPEPDEAFQRSQFTSKFATILKALMLNESLMVRLDSQISQFLSLTQYFLT
ncbi:hypothetical protein [Leptodesmis sp.]|uniref:hypothetical protein n=1 Tax=Leptodesmis sp. TaxID=3100501 RepID=UPI0040534BD9